MLGLKRNSTTPNHPQSDGLVERFNRTLKSTIFKLAADFDTSWDLHIDWAVANYRFAVNSSLPDCPFFMMTGQDPRLPISAMADDQEVVCDRGVTEWRSEFFQNMQLVAKEARKAIQATQAEMKIRYDRRAAEHTFVPGDLVLMRGQARRPGRKLDAAFTGPYRVLRQGELSNNVVVIAMRDGSEKHINIAHLRTYRARPGELIATLADQLAEEQMVHPEV
jgi:transposase InsO family protein